MKKLFFILSFLPLWGTGGFALAADPTSVSIAPITANYTASPPTVTFQLSWPAGTRDADNRSEAWVYIEYKKVLNNAYAGDWERAGIVETATITSIQSTSASYITGNTSGFFLQGPATGAFAATVTVPVAVNLPGDYSKKFAWCAYATDRRPYAEATNGYYILHGSPPFTITTTGNGDTVTESSQTYNATCIYDLTDATGCPGEIPFTPPEITGFTASASSICAGQSVTLTATTTGAAASYSFNNGNSWKTTNTTVRTPENSFTYTLLVQPAPGACTVSAATAVIPITVHPLPVPVFDNPPAGICPNSAATLMVSGAGSGGSYCFTYECTACVHNPYLTGNDEPAASDCYWYSECIYSEANTYTVAMPDAGSLTVWVRAVNEYGCVDSTSITIGSAMLPTISLLSGNDSQTLCLNTAMDAISYTLTCTSGATVTGLPAGVTGAWNDGVVTITGAPAETGIFPYTVTVAGLQQGATGTITVNALPAPTGANSPAVCHGQTAGLSVSGGAGTYSWTVGGAAAETTTSGNYTTAALWASTTYSVTLTDANGCTSAAATGNITVNALPTLSGANSPTICNGAAATLTVTGSAGTYSWTVGGAAAQTTTAANYTTAVLTATTTYSVTLTDANGCTSAAATGNIAVNALTTLSGANSPTICNGAAATLTVTGSAGTYSWTVGGAAAQTTTSGNYTTTALTASATYSVTLTDDNGCTSAAATGTITVYPAFSAGAITTASATTTPGTAPNVTVADATAASGGDGTITYQWRRSGTSPATLTGSNSTYALNTDAANYSADGLYYFTRYAKDNTCNTAFTASGGQYTLRVGPPPPPSAGTNTYKCGTRTWSEPVKMAECNKSSFTWAQYTPDCRSYTWNGINYFYYNWEYVNTNKNTMCPSPWFVPELTHYNIMRSCYNVTEPNGTYFPENSLWGGAVPGYGDSDGSVNYSGGGGFYWTLSSGNGSDDPTSHAYAFEISVGGHLHRMWAHSKNYGFQLRCVR